MTLRAYGRLFAARFGDDPLRVLALHGWGRTRSDFDAVLDGYPALAADLPGFGASPVPDEPIGAAGYAALIEPLLSEFPSPPIVVGHSFGGRVAVALAARHPEKVAGLVLVGVPLLRPAAGRNSPPWRYRLLRAGARWRLVSHRRLEAAKQRYGSADYRAASGVMRDILVKVVNESYEADLERLRCPVRMVWGESDTAAPVAVARAALELIDDGTLDIVEGAGHNVHLSHPDRLRAAIDGLLT